MELPLHLPPTPESVRYARTVVLERARAAGAGTEALEALRLLTSEVATNVVLHARTPYDVLVQSEGDRVRVTIRDGSPAPTAARFYDADSSTGRGVRLVATLSAAHGTAVHADGKSVWFEVPKIAVQLDDDRLAALFAGTIPLELNDEQRADA